MKEGEKQKKVADEFSCPVAKKLKSSSGEIK